MSWAWQSLSTFRGRKVAVNPRRLLRSYRCATGTHSNGLWLMRDASASYWFQVGDHVRVVEDVIKAGHNLKGKQGQVVETWEKCDVDPTCCCAEQVDTGMAVRVQFSNDGGEEDESYLHYFSEEELIKIEEKASVAFDGMTCSAFKMEQLQKMQSQPRGIASFEPQRAQEDVDS